MLTACRACKSTNLHLFLPMGLHPPANAFVREDQIRHQEPSFPLDAIVCLDCALIQVADQIPPDFFRHYLYVPSLATTMHEHFGALARSLATRELPRGRVVDIGCNDGLFLKACKAQGLPVLGIEPARNLAEVTRGHDIEVVNEYFTPEIAHRTREAYGPASVIVTTNTLNHIGDLHAFTEGVRILLDPEGLYIIEVPHALDLIEKNEFDTIYHEHMSEFSVRSLVRLLEPFDMELVDIERLPVHGGSMRVFAQSKPTSSRAEISVSRTVQPSVGEWLAAEETAGLFEREIYDAFAHRVEHNRATLTELLSSLKAQGKRIVGYGAPAKGNSLLNYFKIGPDVLTYLVDRNALKHELYSPGMHIPIVPAERLLADQPDYVLILAWNFADEIMRQQAEYRNRGGRFILPVPEPIVV